MNEITIVDARMGRGKSSAAIRYMNEHKRDKRFLYITPYLDEVARICEQCGFDQPDSDTTTTKSSDLKKYLHQGKNVSATHSLFYLMDKDALDLVREKHYSLIVDESVQVIERLCITNKDTDIITNTLTKEDERGLLHWIDQEYVGRFSDYKGYADVGALLHLDSALIHVMSPELIQAFDEVFMLTYLFKGQYQQAYLDFFGLPYHIVGITKDADGYKFSDSPDCPPPVDYSQLIRIESSKALNRVGNGTFALSKNWWARHAYNHQNVREVRNDLRNFFSKFPEGNTDTRLWTTFKDAYPKMLDPRYKRFRGNFLQIGAKATNEYKNRTDVAYLANRFADPNLTKFFATRDVSVDSNTIALSEMLQWIWRSAIRDGQPINLYVPSRRMRKLLTDWIEKVKRGGPVDG